MIHLLFAIHNHQPVGNFDFIFARAYDRAYRPFLDVLKAHPGIRISLHFSGILLDWLEKHRPEYLRDVRGLCEAGRIEILGGAYYEPILPMLSDADKEGQIRKLSRRAERLFGAVPRGMWLAERVWEPSLVAPIARCGIEYVLLDGSHFKMVGKTDTDLAGYYQTEDQGHCLKLFPIHDLVRDTIPFRAVEEVVASLRALDAAGQTQIVFGDDGEKFGDWPHTYETVYAHGWLDRFFSAIEADPLSFAVRPLRDGLDASRNLGLVYLPPASYQEMMVWAQNPGDIPRFRGLQQWLRDSGRGEEAERFLRGTFWRNFLSKYSESNRMHKQGMRLSALLERPGLDAEAAAKARDHVWQSQCNCAYWHGVFGGLYLPHLRFALYRHLIAAQKALDPDLLRGATHGWEAADWDYDGRVEHLFNTPALLLSFAADGSVNQFWLKRTGINLCDTLTRRREAYHAFIASGPQGGTKLENQIGSKEEGLLDHLIYDLRERTAFSEWLLPPETSFQAYRRQEFAPALKPVFGPPVLQAGASAAEILLRGRASLEGEGVLEIDKTYSVAWDGRSMRVAWKFRARGGTARFRFAAETLFCLLAGNAPDRYVSWDGGARRDILAGKADMPGVTRLQLADEWLRLRCGLEAAGAAGIWRDAIETVSQSEGGYERVYQGTVAAPIWDFDLADGAVAEAQVRLEIAEEGPDGEQGA